MTSLVNSRWSKKPKLEEDDKVDENNNLNETILSNLSIVEGNEIKCDVAVQCEISKRDISCQSSSSDSKKLWNCYFENEKKFILLANLLTILRSEVSSFIQNRCLSVFLFIILRHFGINWYVIEVILKKFECLNIKHAHKWANKIFIFQ